MNWLQPPIFCQSASLRTWKDLVAYAVATKLEPSEYTSGPLPLTAEVWIFDVSSEVVEKVSNWRSAPVLALNCCCICVIQARCWAGYVLLTPTRTSSFLPAPPEPPVPQAAVN